MKMNICYIILHYKNINETIKCIESLNSTAGDNSKFLIVDNGSNDGTGEKLSKMYKDNSAVTTLILDNNLGFSAGNNEGYFYAKKEWNPEFIIFTNNDVVFYQKDFEKKVSEIYDKTAFDVLGPDIYIPKNKEHQSPLFQRGITVEELETELKEYRYYEKYPKKFTRRLQIHFIKNRICSKYPIVRKIYSKIRKKDNIDYRKEYFNVGLQGSCLIVSKSYIAKEEKMFSPEPFLYCEEVFLYYKCMEKGYKMVYSPEIGIRHEEAASFKNISKNSVDKNRFMLKHHVKARELLLSYLKDCEEKNNFRR